MDPDIIISYYQTFGAGLIVLSTLYMAVNIIRRMVNRR